MWAHQALSGEGAEYGLLRSKALPQLPDHWACHQMQSLPTYQMFHSYVDLSSPVQSDEIGRLAGGPYWHIP